jgi:hypothetical protein
MKDESVGDDLDEHFDGVDSLDGVLAVGGEGVGAGKIARCGRVHHEGGERDENGQDDEGVVGPAVDDVDAEYAEAAESIEDEERGLVHVDDDAPTNVEISSFVMSCFFEIIDSSSVILVIFILIIIVSNAIF